jgi:hypothetical protein
MASSPRQSRSERKRFFRRLKKVYRMLCRRLHPDAGQTIPDRNTLWSDAQDAYARRDVERLETLLALSHMKGNRFAATTTIADIISVTEHYRRARCSVRGLLRRVRHLPEYGFLKWSNEQREAHGRRLRRELQRQRDGMKGELEKIEATVAELCRTPESSPRRVRRRRTTAHRTNGSGAGRRQTEFSF